MLSTNTPCFYHLTIENYIQVEDSVDNQYFFFFWGLKKVKIAFYVFIHNILAKKQLSLVICSWLLD